MAAPAREVQARLQSAIDVCLPDHSLTEEQRLQLLNATERVSRQLQQALQSRTALPTRTQATPSYLLQSPVYRPLSPVPADVEIQQLEEEVNLAAQRAAAVRLAAPAKLKEIYAEKLAQLRPSVEALKADGGAAEPAADPAASTEQGQGQENPGEHRDALHTYSPDPRQLKDKLADAGSKLPVLRARLEEASDRVQRVFAVLTTELNRPPPNTVERAVLGKTPGRPADKAPGGTSAGKQALEAGTVSMRRRLRKDLQPVPLALPEATDE